jgi:hypothetical protein
MLDLTLETTLDTVTDVGPTVTNDNLTQPPALITEQEVMLGTAAVVSPRSTTIARRMIDALHVVGAAFRPPPPRPHYAHRAAYIERAAMAREMDRL